MAVAVLALVGLLLSTYLLMYKLGLTGPLVCGAGETCERVQTSRWAVFLGLPVAAYGVAGYLSLLVVALAGIQDRWAGSPGPTLLLAALSGVGLLFTAYLTYLELFVIHAICRWCVGSALLIVAIFMLSVSGMKGVMRDS